ncbi:hypothetical protein F4810DRAFT_441963 [Camillea tinctor]|nr:hypothetical protein F4810DRAFT_441963 [Camillea tinctor]
MESIPPVNPDDLGRGPMVMGITWTFTILSIVVVGLRFYVRLKIFKFYSIEDWLMLAALVFLVVSQGCVSVAYHYGIGKYDADIEQPTQMVNVLKWIWLSVAPGMVVSILARISIAMLLVQLFGVHKWFKWFIIIITVVQTVLCVLIIPFTYSQVRPTEALWNIYLLNVERWDHRVVLYMEYIGQSLYTISDITYVLFPVIIIWRLNMPTRRKVGLVLLLAGSLFTAAISILKTTVAQGGGAHYITDVQYEGSLAIIWSTLEEALVIIMGSIPALRAITKLNISVSSTIGSFLSSVSKKIKNPAYSTGNINSGAYHDLERGTYNLGQVGTNHNLVADVPIITHNQYHNSHGSSQNIPRHVLRTDEFSISYD